VREGRRVATSVQGRQDGKVAGEGNKNKQEGAKTGLQRGRRRKQKEVEASFRLL
jgi:hypothetical protein